MFPHVHDFPELLSWWGTDPDHPEDTTAMGMLLGDEEIPLNRSWVAYIPAGMMHMPTRRPEGRITGKPVCHWTSGPGGTYTREKEKPEAEIAQKKEAATVKDQENRPIEKRQIHRLSAINRRSRGLLICARLNPKYTRPMAYIDETVVPGAEFGCDTLWLLPGDKSKAGQMIMDAHTLPHGTSITLTAMNYADITDLCAEAELWIGGEKHIINKSFGAYIPPDVEQGPLIIRNITQQIFFKMSQPVGEGIKKYPGR